jgi:membrane-bound lytic murein transglycosylase C
MGSFKIKNIFLGFILFIFVQSIALSKDNFADFLKNQQSDYTQYKDKINEEFNAYKKAHNDAFKEFSKELGKKWPKESGKPVVSTKHKWVEYEKNLNSRKSVDFAKKEISFDVIAKTEKEAKKR